MEKEKKRSGPTNAGTCTSVVRANRGANKKALPLKDHHHHQFRNVLRMCLASILE